jgi:hypothetical protein
MFLQQGVLGKRRIIVKIVSLGEIAVEKLLIV